MSAMIEIRDATKIYETSRGTTVSLDHVSLDVEEGEFITLVGPSGCGKSTMLNLIAGLLSARAAGRDDVWRALLFLVGRARTGPA